MPSNNPRSLFAVACFLVVLGCSRTRGDEELGRAISTAAHEGGSDVNIVDVPVLAPFAWERLFVFPPYTSAATVGQELGFSWPEARRMEKRDDSVLLVFVNKGQVVRFVDVPRRTDFAGVSRKGGFSYSDAVFRCKKGPEAARICASTTGG
jgi:hypothetical protein